MSGALPELQRHVLGADLLHAESSLIHICCLCLFGDQDGVVGQMYLVFSRTELLFHLLINALTFIINRSNFIAMTVQDDNCNPLFVVLLSM